jgi:hypothetical protein
MAYQTGTAAGLQDLMDQLVTFATANGWTLIDTVQSPNDKVIKSTGVDGKQNLVVRLTNEARLLDYTGASGSFTVPENITASGGRSAQIVADAAGTLKLINVVGLFYPGDTITGQTSAVTATVASRIRFQTYKGPDDVHNAFDYIFVRGYTKWTVGGGTGVNEFGKWGPWLTSPPSGSRTTQLDFKRLKDIGAVPLNFSNVLPFRTQAWQRWDGRRRIYEQPNTLVLDGPPWRYFDIQTSQVFGLATLTNLGDTGRNQMVMTHDRATDKDFLWALGDTTGATSATWRVYDAETNTWTDRAATPTGHHSSSLCWDGGDFIYALRGGDTTDFWRYQISTDAWTVLTAAPVLRTGLSQITTDNMMYLPKGSVTGVTEDCIIAFLQFNPNSTIRLYKYNVQTDTWDGSPWTVLPYTVPGQNSLVFTWDNDRYVYSARMDSSQDAWRLDLTNVAGGWTNIGQWQIGAGGDWGSMIHMNQMVCKIKGHVSNSIEYWAVVDADALRIVTKVSGNYYWAYAGNFDTFYKSTVMTTTSPVTLGSSVTIPVDATTGYAIGDPVYLVDPMSGAFEKTSISAILSGPPRIKATIINNYGTGSRIGTEAGRNVLTSDIGFAVFMADPEGYESDKQASEYFNQPIVPIAVTDRGSPTSRGFYQAFPIGLYGPQPELAAFENRGVLNGVFSLKNGAFPAAQAEDVIQVGASQYKVFPVYETRGLPDISSENRLIAIGPIN